MPSLVTVNGARIELKPNSSYVLGRSSDCDVVVGDMACSRRHASLTVGGEQRRGLFIEDLGSRNGTFVNDVRIYGRTTIKDGCTVRIGATVYLLVMGEGEGRLDTGTVGIEKLSLGMEIDEEMLATLRKGGVSNTNFAGRLETFSLIDVLQLLLHSHRSGTLHVSLEGQGKIEIRQGEVYQASYQDFDGFHALVMMARETEAGRFWLVDSDTPCTKTIEESGSRLLVDLCCALDEKEAV